MDPDLALAPRERLAAGVGGHLALEFANTVGWHLSATPVERLRSWPDLVRWAGELGVVASAEPANLQGGLGELGDLITLREAIFGVGRRLASGERPQAPDIEMIRRAAAGAEPAVEVGGALHWTFDRRAGAVQLGAVLAREALALFCSPRAHKIAICEGGDCGWLFVDESRTGRRRWCSMDGCGSRAKSKRHYRRAAQATHVD